MRMIWLIFRRSRNPYVKAFALLSILGVVICALVVKISGVMDTKFFEVAVNLPNGCKWGETRHFWEDEYQVSRREAQLPCYGGDSLNQAGIIAYFNAEMIKQGWTPEIGDNCDAGFPESRDMKRGKNFMSYDAGGVYGQRTVCVGVLDESDHYRVIFVILSAE